MFEIKVQSCLLFSKVDSIVLINTYVKIMISKDELYIMFWRCVFVK